jgi:hypothetical protein
MLFMEQGARGGMVVVHLWRYAERVLEQLGRVQMSCHSRRPTMPAAWRGLWVGRSPTRDSRNGLAAARSGRSAPERTEQWEEHQSRYQRAKCGRADAGAAVQEQLEWAKQIYGETADERAAATAVADQVSRSQLEAQNLQNKVAQAGYEDYTSTYRPLEQKLVADAQAYDTPERRAAELPARAPMWKPVSRPSAVQPCAPWSARG